MRKTWVAPVAVCVALFSAGCEATLDGTCDDATHELAFRVACTPDLAPQYAGQALVNGSCAGGYCHSAHAVNDATRPQPDQRDKRHGVPGGFDFDLVHPTSAAELEQLRRNHARVFEDRGRLFAQVESHDMPRAAAGVPGVRSDQGIFADTAESLPTLDTPAGLAILRAWLVCGAPVVERTTDEPALPGAPVGDAVDPLLCAPPEPNFQALFDNVIRGSCALSLCHAGRPSDGGDPAGMLHLDPADADASYASLVGVAAMGLACGPVVPRLTRVLPGNPDDSLLIQKLEGGAVCGDRMPLDGPYLSAGVIAAFREWIAAGARR